MKNVAETNEYLELMDDIGRHLFVPERFKCQKLKELNSELSVLLKNYFYDSDNPDYPFNLRGCEVILYRDGAEIYSYKTVDTEGACWTFTHQNGHEYFLFTKGLYGYSVLDLTTMLDFHFYPDESFPTRETFIWCDAHYNPKNNILAVGGCYWACPSSVVLADFSEPMKEALQVDVNDFYNNNDHYDNIDFVAWECTDLILKMSSQTEPGKRENRCISSEEYMKWL